MRSVLVAAALAASAVAVGTGRDGDFCGDTGLGFLSALLDPVSGWGTLNVGRNSMPITLKGNQIISTSTNDKGVVVAKMTDCIYGVEVNFDDSSVSILAGPPASEGDAALHTCMRLTLEEDNLIRFARNAAGAACPPSATNASEIGTITGFQKNEFDARYGPACPPGAKLLPEAWNATSTDHWIRPTFVAAVSDGSVVQFCVQSWTAPSPTDDSLLNVDLIIPGSGAACVPLKAYRTAGLLGYGDATAECAPFNAATASLSSVTWLALPTPDAASGAPSAPAGPPLVRASAPVAAFTATYSVPAGVTLASMADACVAFVLRKAYADNLGLPVSKFLLKSLRSGGVTLPLDAASPANTIAAACAPPPPRRVLREAAPVRLVRQLTASTIAVDALAAMPASDPAASTALIARINTMPTGAATPASLAAALSTATGAAISAADLGVVLGSATQSTAVVLVEATYPPRIDPYNPDPMLLEYHNLPRQSLPIAGGDGGDPGNTFSTNMEYLTGAVGPAAGLIGFAIVVLVVFAIVYPIVCCRCLCCSRTRCRRKRSMVRKLPCKVINTPCINAVLAVLNVALILSVIGSLPGFGDGISKLKDSADGFVGVLRSSSDLLASSSQVLSADGTLIDSMKTATTVAASNAAALKTRAASNPNTPQAVLDMLDAIRDGANAGKNTAIDTSATLTSTANTFDDALNQVDTGMIRSQIGTAGNLILALLAVAVAANYAFICRWNCAAWVYKILKPITLILTVLIIILAGVFLVFGVLGSDVCVDPSSTIRTLVGSSMTGLVGDTLNYFLACGTQPYIPLAGGAALIDDAVEQVEGAAQQVRSLLDQVIASPNSAAFAELTPSRGPELQNIADAMDAAAAATREIATSQLSCQRVDSLLSMLFDGLCNGGILTMVKMSRVLIAASAFLFIQLVLGVDVCCYHPGDAGAWDEEDAPATDGKSVEMVGATKAPLTVRQPAGAAPPMAAGPHMGSHA